MTGAVAVRDDHRLTVRIIPHALGGDVGRRQRPIPEAGHDAHHPDGSRGAHQHPAFRFLRLASASRRASSISRCFFSYFFRARNSAGVGGRGFVVAASWNWMLPPDANLPALGRRPARLACTGRSPAGSLLGLLATAGVGGCASRRPYSRPGSAATARARRFLIRAATLTRLPAAGRSATTGSLPHCRALGDTRARGHSRSVTASCCHQRSSTRATPSSVLGAVTSSAAARTSGWALPIATPRPAHRSIGRSLGMSPNASTSAAVIPSGAAISAQRRWPC